MKTYKVESISSMYSTKKLNEHLEKLLNERAQEGYEVVSINYSYNILSIPTVYITFCK
jgi:hypothetical protein